MFKGLKREVISVAMGEGVLFEGVMVKDFILLF